MPKEGSKGSSPVLSTKRSKDKTENNQSVSKEGHNKGEPKKRSGKKNKKSVDVAQKQSTALLAGKTDHAEQISENIARETNSRRGHLDQKIVLGDHSDPTGEKRVVLNEEIISKTDLDISRSKKRRIRKRRLLQSLGINDNSVNTTENKTTTKKKKKNKSKYTTDSDILREESLHKDCTGLKLVGSRTKEIICDIVEKRGAVRRSEDTVAFTPKLKDTYLRKLPQQVTKLKETELEKNIFTGTLGEVKEGNVVTDSIATLKACFSCEDLQFSAVSDSKIPSEDISLQFLSDKEEPSTLGKVDLVSLLSHNNVEGLFRSALLNDVTLSSRCSEKEVRNFFNTYGTFSERGRTQFAAVEKLLCSSSKDTEDVATSQYFEPVLNKDTSVQNSCTIVNKEYSLNLCTSSFTSVTSPSCEYFSLENSKDNVDAGEQGSVSSVGNSENGCSYKQVITGLNHIDSVGNSLVFKGGFCRGPIYTSPTVENRVTSSANSNQILNGAKRGFVPYVYESCDINQQNKFDSHDDSSVQKLDSQLVDGNNDLSVKHQFLPGAETKLSEVCSLPEQSHTCNVSQRLEDSCKEEDHNYARILNVNTVECEVDFVCKNDDLSECTAGEEKAVPESHFLVNSDYPKEEKPICTRLSNDIYTAPEKADSETHQEEIERNSDVETYRLIGFVSEYGENIQETGFEASKTVEGVISLKTIEEAGQKALIFSHICPAEVHNLDCVSNTRNEPVCPDIDSNSSSKEQEAVSGCSSVAEVSECVESSLVPSPQDTDIMNPSSVKPIESSNIHRQEKCREEILAAREAKKAAKLARNKNKLVPTSEDVAAAKTQSTAGSSKSIQQPKPTTDAGKHEIECLTEAKSVSKNTFLGPDMKNLHSPLRDTSQEKSTAENNMPMKKTELKRMKDEVPQVENKVATGSMKEGNTSGTTQILGEEGKETGHGAQSLTILPTPKNKAELRAERRAKQEQQRTLKAAQQQAKVSQAKSTAMVTTVNSKEKQPGKDVGNEVSNKVVGTVQVTRPKTLEHRVKLFNHLYHERGPLAFTKNLMLCGHDLHPAVMRLGMQYADRVVVGSNARCIALLNVLKQIIKDYETPPQKEFSRGLEAELQPSVAFLDRCRPLSVSMTNALRHLTWQLTQLPNSVSDSEAKKKLLEAIDTYIREQIEVAAQAICIMVRRKIADGDVILTYGCSSLLKRILVEAHRSGTKFRVVVVDGRPWREGREMLRRLVECGLDCSYILVSAASFIMREVTKVFLGAHALLANGYVMSRAGSSQVALLAHSCNVPVLVCCETHKFCERVQTDSVVYNELGDPDELIPTDFYVKEYPLSKWKSIGSLTPLNLTYDVTPPDLVTAVVTELAILPCTSVPVILRIKPTETGC